MSENAGTKQQKENALPKEQLEAGKKWLQLVAEARTDKTLKQRLMDTPIVVLREHGINVRKGLDIHVVENTDNVVYLTLPAVSQLSDRELNGGEVSVLGIALTLGEAIVNTGAAAVSTVSNAI